LPIRRATAPLIVAVLCAACSSSDDAPSSATAATTTTTTTPVVLYTQQQCAEQAQAAAQPLQDFVDQYQGLSAEEWNALDPPPDIQAVQDDVIAIAQAAADHGCDTTNLQDDLDSAIASLEATSEVGKAIVAALRGLGPPLGPPRIVTVPETTQPRDVEPSTVAIDPGDDVDEQLRAALDTIADGSTIQFGEGVYELTDPVIVNIGVSFVGAGRDVTTLRSTAEGMAVAFVGPGGFAMTDLTLEHTGEAEASVFLAIEGPVQIEHATVRGGVVGQTAGTGGGHGIVFAFDPIEGFPDRTDSERAGPLEIDDTIVTGNAAAGMLATGRASPQITASTISENGGCGLCYIASSRGSVTNTTVEGNEIGVQAAESTAPRLRDSTFVRNRSVGISFDGASTGSLTRSVVEENASVGVQIAGTSTASVTATSISQSGVGVLVSDTATPVISGNTLADHDVGVQVGGEADVQVRDNEISRSATAGISLTDTAGGTVSGNTFGDTTGVGVQVSGSATPGVSGNTFGDGTGIGVQAAGSARPTITGNTIEGTGSVGISFLETSGGTVSGNRIISREIGVQIGGSSTAAVSDNDIDGATAVGILFAESATGSAKENRVTAPEAVGIMASGTSRPEIDRNRVRDSAAGLVFRESASGNASFNTLTGHAVGVQIIDQATPFLDGNVVTDSKEAGVVVGGSAEGTLSRNTIVRNGNVGVRVAESARPDVLGNEIRGPGVYAMIYQDDAGGQANANVLADHVFGIQLSGNASPDITNNTLQGVALTGISYADNAGGSISGNDCGGTGSGQISLGAGISITPPANPTVGENNCSVNRS
jgi:parallel beta-helix repeat protein